MERWYYTETENKEKFIRKMEEKFPNKHISNNRSSFLNSPVLGCFEYICLCDYMGLSFFFRSSEALEIYKTQGAEIIYMDFNLGGEMEIE